MYILGNVSVGLVAQEVVQLRESADICRDCIRFETVAVLGGDYDGDNLLTGSVYVNRGASGRIYVHDFGAGGSEMFFYRADGQLEFTIRRSGEGPGEYQRPMPIVELPEWASDFARFRPGLYRIALVCGSRSAKLAALRSQADVYVTNFETTVSMEGKFRALFRSRPDRSVLAVDESFFVKSPEAQRTRSIRRIREWCNRAFVLCGTPAPNSPHDLVEQFNLVDFGLAFEDVTIPSDRETALPLVQAVIEKRGLLVRNLKEDVLPTLPGRTVHRYVVSLQPKQAQLYEVFRDRLVTDVQAVSEAEFRGKYSAFLARRIALLQVCSNPASVRTDYDEIPAKMVLLDDLLERQIEQGGEKVVLWSFYKASIDALVARYSHYGAVRYDGTVADAIERGEAVRRFQEDEQTRLFIANPAAAGAGLTLHRARVAIYESMSNQAAHYLQSLDRIHRRGQEREVEYYILLCEDTVELSEYERLLEKQQMAIDLFRDDVSPPKTRESFLRDLTPGKSLSVESR